MTTLGILGGLGAPEIFILFIPIIIMILGIVFPILWISERRRRKYWQAKAEGYEKRLIEKE
jgi:hypothetical protein